MAKNDYLKPGRELKRPANFLVAASLVCLTGLAGAALTPLVAQSPRHPMTALSFPIRDLFNTLQDNCVTEIKAQDSFIITKPDGAYKAVIAAAEIRARASATYTQVKLFVEPSSSRPDIEAAYQGESRAVTFAVLPKNPRDCRHGLRPLNGIKVDIR